MLAEAEVVVYDHLSSERLLDLAPAGALLVPAGKWKNHATLSQDAINATLVEHAQLGRRVVRLKGGDPFVFGRGGEEAEHLLALASAHPPKLTSWTNTGQVQEPWPSSFVMRMDRARHALDTASGAFGYFEPDLMVQATKVVERLEALVKQAPVGSQAYVQLAGVLLQVDAQCDQLRAALEHLDTLYLNLDEGH